MSMLQKTPALGLLSQCTLAVILLSSTGVGAATIEYTQLQTGLPTEHRVRAIDDRGLYLTSVPDLFGGSVEPEQVVLIAPSGQRTVIANRNTPIPGASGTFGTPERGRSTFGSVAITRDRAVFNGVHPDGRSGLYAWDGQDLSSFVPPGTALPGGGQLATVGPVSGSDAGVLFRGVDTVGAAGLYLASGDGSLDLVYSESGYMFDGTTFVPTGPTQLLDGDAVYFGARTEDPGRSSFFRWQAGVFEELFSLPISGHPLFGSEHEFRLTGLPLAAAVAGGDLYLVAGGRVTGFDDFFYLYRLREGEINPVLLPGVSQVSNSLLSSGGDLMISARDAESGRTGLFLVRDDLAEIIVEGGGQPGGPSSRNLQLGAFVGNQLGFSLRTSLGADFTSWLAVIVPEPRGTTLLLPLLLLLWHRGVVRDT